VAFPAEKPAYGFHTTRSAHSAGRPSDRAVTNDQSERKSLLKDVSAGKQKGSHTYVFPPRPFRNGLKRTAGPNDFFATSGLFLKESWLRPRAFDLINNCRVQAAHGNISHRKASSPKTRCNPWIPETLMDGYMGCDQARNRVKYSERMKYQTWHLLNLCKQVSGVAA
jgi:hypothetical protein